MKIASEYKTRQALLNVATNLGCKIELQRLFDKYDNLLKNCTNESELKHIQMLCLYDINNLLDVYYKIKTVQEIKKEDESPIIKP